MRILNTFSNLPVDVLLCLFLFISAASAGDKYCWLTNPVYENTIIHRIAPPSRFERISLEESSFAYWLRHLPLKREGRQVLLYDGEPKHNQSVHHAVIDIDVGSSDLQQCADAVIRLRAEYLYSIGAFESIHFNFTSGDTAWFSRWIEGYRPTITDNDVRWEKSAETDSSYSNFRKYLDCVMTYAGTYSLEKELFKVNDVHQMKVGDVFIQGGFPGHAVLVVDLAENSQTRDKWFLLIQSFMPAQDVHILKNPLCEYDPWYPLDFGEMLYTPEWTFGRDDLYRFRCSVD